MPSALKVLLWVNHHLAEHLALLKIFEELNQTAGVAYGFWFALNCTNCTKKSAMLSEPPQIAASSLRFVECSDHLRARHKPILVKQTQARDESESFAKLGAFGHSRPRTFRGDLAIHHNCTDISAIDYEIGSKYVKTLGNLCRIVLLIRAQLQVAGSWFLPADFANPAKRPDVGANATADQTQRLAVTISLGDKCAFNIFCEIHFAPIRSTFIRLSNSQTLLIT